MCFFPTPPRNYENYGNYGKQPHSFIYSVSQPGPTPHSRSHQTPCPQSRPRPTPTLRHEAYSSSSQKIFSQLTPDLLLPAHTCQYRGSYDLFPTGIAAFLHCDPDPSFAPYEHRVLTVSFDFSSAHVTPPPPSSSTSFLTPRNLVSLPLFFESAVTPCLHVSADLWLLFIRGH
jgi:hypothetical protein